MRILFVCTGNIFRSVAAELSTRKYLEEQGTKDIEVGSAGIAAIAQPFSPIVDRALEKQGISGRHHHQTKLTEELFKAYDLVVAMAENHQAFIKGHFGKDVPLFNEIAYGTKESILDVDEAVHNWILHPRASMEYTEKTVAYIHDAIPAFFRNVKNFIQR